MSEVLYNPLEDDDVRIPIYQKNGKNMIFPAFICGVKPKSVQSKNGEDLIVCELEFEIHESAEKMSPVTIYEETEDGKYDYRRPKEEVPATTFTGQRIKAGQKSKLWKNETKGSGRMNRMLIDSLKVIGIDVKTKKVETDGKKVDAIVIPELTEELLIGLPVWIWLDEESFTGRDGKNVTYTAVGKYAKIDGIERVTVLENSLKEVAGAGKSDKKLKDDDPFSDIDDDLPF
jgi:hypothetical protein